MTSFTNFLRGLSDSEVIFGANDYVEYRPGNINLIISVPHDGRRTPGK